MPKKLGAWSLTVLGILQQVNGKPAAQTQWTPGNGSGQRGFGIDRSSTYKNSTTTADLTSITSNSCALNCTRLPVQGVVQSWLPISVTATITAATVIHIVNTKSNTTRDVTITNSEADLTNRTAPTETNSLGTRTFLVTDVAPDGTGNITFPVAFPTLYTKYPQSVVFQGALPTTVSDEFTCLRAANQTSMPFPSRPTFAQTPFLPMNTFMGASAVDQNSRFEHDPKGWTWVPNSGMLPNLAKEVEELFPSLGVWSCDGIPLHQPFAPTVHNTALYVTQTMFTTESDDDTWPSGKQFESALLPALTGPVALHTAANLAPSPAAANPTPIEAVSPLLAELDSTLGVLAPGSVATPGPQIQSGLLIVGSPITAAAQANGVASSEGAPPIAIGGLTVMPNAQSRYIVSGQTFEIGSSITLYNGPLATVVGLQVPGSQTELVVGSSTSILSPSVMPPPTPPLTVGGQVYSANGQGQYIIGGQTLIPGDAVDVNGTAISLAPGATQLVAGSSTENLEGQLPTGSQPGLTFTGTASAWTSPSKAVTVASGLAVMFLLI